MSCKIAVLTTAFKVPVGNSSIYKVREVYMHPDFEPRLPYINDIAVLQLMEELSMYSSVEGSVLIFIYPL
jgi:hypothetical protein